MGRFVPPHFTIRNPEYIMRIIAKQHDYYDFAMGYGIDPKVVYIREPKTGVDVPRGWAGKRDNYVNLSTGKPAYLYKITVAICGKRWRLYSMSDMPTKKTFFSWSEAVVGYSAPRFYRYWQNEDKSVIAEPTDINTKMDSPVIVFGVVPEYPGLLKNDGFNTNASAIGGVIFDEKQYTADAPILQYIGMPDILPAEEVFMMIDSWISARGVKDDVVFEDKYKIQQAGFDNKTSFRNMKR